VSREGQEGQGNTCALCNGHSVKLTSLRTWKDERAQLVANPLQVNNHSVKHVKGILEGWHKIQTMYLGGWNHRKSIVVFQAVTRCHSPRLKLLEDHIALTLGITDIHLSFQPHFLKNMFRN